jgi:hypothetical protein
VTIEVRQMVIKSTVGDDHGSYDAAEQDDAKGGARGGARADARQEELERLRSEILAECQEIVALKLRDMTER